MTYKFDIEADQELDDKIRTARFRSSPELPGLLAQREAIWGTYHNHPKIQIGNALIIDDPVVIAAYRRKRPYTPGYRKRPASTKPTGKRVNCGYDIPYIPRKVTRLIETKPGDMCAGWYVDGFWSNGKYIIKAPCPKTKRPLNPNTDSIRNFINKYMVYGGGLGPAVIGKETRELDQEPMVALYGETDNMVIPAEQLDIMFWHYPRAMAHIKGNMAIFTAGNDVIGIIMRVLD
jgi:hypothetical protein